MARRLTRDSQRGVFGGVAAGFGEYLEVDPVLVRLGFVLLAFVHGLGVLFYLACWFVMPRGELVVPAPATNLDGVAVEGVAPPSRLVAPSADAAAAQLAVGSILVIVGGLLLAHNLDWLRWPAWMRFETLWPLLLVALGAGLIAKSRRVS